MAEFETPLLGIDLAARMRVLRNEKALKQSEIAERMGVHPSIISLWEHQGKRHRDVPAARLFSLAEALEVPIEALLTEAQLREAEGLEPTRALVPVKNPHEERNLLEFLLQHPQKDQIGEQSVSATKLEPWMVPPRPPLEGLIPAGWEPKDRIRDISPSLPDGYWLDPIKIEFPSMRLLLASRLPEDDKAVAAAGNVPGAAIAERLFQTRADDKSFIHPRLPLVEQVFRLTTVAENGGLKDLELLQALRERRGVPISATLLSRMSQSVRPYPIRRVDANLFGRYR